jgi:hypothetical protein
MSAVARLPGNGSRKRTRDVLGTVALFAVMFGLGGVLVGVRVAAPLAAHLLVR